MAAILPASHVLASPASFTFMPPNPGWIPVLNGGVPLTDVEGDVPGDRDLVGDAANPMLYIASDATHIYFRLRIDVTALKAQLPLDFAQHGWGCFINTDANLQTYEFSTIIDGVANPDEINFYKNTVTTIPNSPQEQPDMPPLSTDVDPLNMPVSHAEVVLAPSMFGGDPDYFIDWAIQRTVAMAAGFDPSQPASYYCGSSNNGTNLDGDCSGGNCTLDAVFSDPVGCGLGGCNVCGDGTLGGSEGCDDGNTSNGDGCNSACLKELGEMCALSGQCASGFCDPAGSICACDQDMDCPAGQLCNTAALPNTCVDPGCGNGVLEPSEACEDGNVMPGDGCNGVCLKEIGQLCGASAECASGFCDPAGVCACDEAADCPAGNQCNTVLDPNQCVPAGCGNMVLEPGEGCDDGGVIPGDGCNSQCLLELGELCLLDAACASGFCDPAGGVCACDQDVDCPAPQICDTTTDPNACVDAICGNGKIEMGEGCDDQNPADGDGCSGMCAVEPGWVCMGEPSICMPAPCGSDADCQFCNEQYSICVQPCGLPSDCPVGFFCDQTSGICVPHCVSGAECPSGVCDAVSGQCVECAGPADCPNGEDCSGGVCGAGCNSDAECGGLICDLSLGICVECLVNDDCQNGLACVDKVCLPGCNEEADCSGVMCNETVGVCVECSNDAECPLGENCDEPTGQCIPIGCIQDSDCPDPLVCDETTGICVECTQDSDCPTGVCDEPAQVCVECTQDSECPSGEVCDESAQVCVECTQDSECPDGEVCDESAQVCVECTQDSDCPDGEVCDQSTNECVSSACDDDSDCPDPLICNEETGECVECTQNSDCPIGVCNTVTFLCGCTSDSDCGDGERCNVDSGACEPTDGVYASGGCVCSAPPGNGTSDERIAIVTGLLALGLLRRRRR